MKDLTEQELNLVGAGYSVGDLGYDVGYGIGYVVGGGAGHDFGVWLYEFLH